MLGDLVGKILDKISGASLLATGLLLSTAFVSALVAYWRAVDEKSWKEFFEFAIPHEVITHPSAKADLLFWVTKKALMPFLMLPAGIVFITAVGYATNWLLSTLFHLQAPLIEGPAGPVTVLIFTITMLLAYDISYYLYHVAQHRYPLLWELHKVHHSAEVMVGITKDRVHPLDELMNRAWDGVVVGICFGIWSLVSLNLVELTVFGVNVYVMRNILMMDFVRHTHFKISFGPLNNVILCPHWHQLHHSTDPLHYDKNFGLLFSFWDRFFGTLCVPKPDEDFKFGLVDRDVRDYQSLAGLYVMPLKRMWGHIARRLRPGKPRTSRSSEGTPS
ncbi:MAG: sterol desaturase family protein [Mesorhizobium sp.]|nr:sterol desaturase family protein [bacterium M00.F.Ca.ET.205.01.1.1]TGU53868.1 sterol desaturase family protein [bacterium M00.F.Ca.ET.152.01.1.1]TGV37366.1 sterol desaturase family protein [Mesorhizobium sp. M00.F.Ca.ET.186.01.1.1]TGZ41274.1 sterol desaturase family protein [bacterium M00.F.Ca.ET.162.01.1.1]TIW62269.1 MAG: sterol desaturase family protein [Mesorhizobium sp.]